MSNKKRSLSQRIGEKGENLVRVWATDNYLSASKFDNDYGIDFTFQHFKEHGKHQIATGVLFFGQCKATEDKNKKHVLLEKADAYLYLSMKVPLCILSVDNIDKEIMFRFVDIELIKVLIEFIESENKTLSLNIDKYFFKTDILQEHIKKYVSSSAIQRIKTFTTKELLTRFEPTVNVNTSVSDDSSIVHLDSKWITSFIDPEVLFNNKKTSMDKIINFNVVEILNEHLPEFDVVYISGAIGRNHYLSSVDSTIKTVCISYPYEGKTYYRTKSGFTLIVGPRVEEKGQYVHYIGYEAKQSPFSLSECSEDCLVFDEIFEEKKLAIDNHSLITNISKHKEIESFFYIVKELHRAIKTQGFDFNKLHASDLNNNHVIITIGIISTLINKSTLLPWFPGFAFDHTKIPLEKLEEIPAKGKVPLAFSLKGKNYVAWLNSTFSWLLDGDLNQILGFKFDKIQSIEINSLESCTDELYKLPELWTESGWPKIPLGRKEKTFSLTLEKRRFSIIEEE